MVIAECRFFKSCLNCQSSSNICRNRTTNKSILAIKVFGNFFQRRIPGLNEEEVDDNQFESEPDTIENIVLPTDVVESDRVDILIEEDCKWKSACNPQGDKCC